MPSDVLLRRPAAGAPRVEVMGLELDNLHRDEIARIVTAAAAQKKKMLVVNANASLVVLAQNNPWIGEMFAQADLAFCDGAGVQLAVKFLTGQSMERTTPPEWIGNVLTALGASCSIFWLGGAPGVVETAAAAYEKKYGVTTAGTQHGFFDMSKGSAETLALVARINAAKPSILLVNMGMPRQERWLWDNWAALQPGVAITAGALVDHAAGRVTRPPRWVANMGVEWLIRLVREPRRLWRRYLLGLPVFGAYVLRYAVAGRKKS